MMRKNSIFYRKKNIYLCDVRIFVLGDKFKSHCLYMYLLWTSVLFDTVM
jgi:hypothetical protein